MSEELELKYDIADPTAVAAWFDARHPAPDDFAAWQTSTVSDRYFDTADGALARAGLGARLRRSDGRTTLSLKADLAISGARHRRLEVEAPATGSLEPGRWPASEARQVVERAAGGGALVPRFTIRQRRRERRIAVAGSSLLVSIDDAQVLAGGRKLGRLHGLEVEHRGGRRRGLRRLEEELARSGLVVAQPLSKLQLGAGMVAAETQLNPDDPFAEAGRKVLARHLLRMLDRAGAARDGDPLALKQMRVATRRMRSVWRVFDGAYRRTDQRRYLAELRDLARRLGAVRDLDVLIERLPADRPDLAPLADAWRDERAGAMGRLLRHLDSPGYRALVTDYRRFTGTTGAATARRRAATRVAELAGERIAATHQRAAAFGPNLATADEATLHALRIAVKRLRYTLETFRPLLPRAPAARLIQRLVAVQDALGAVNDAAVAAGRSEAWLATDHAPANDAARRAVERYATEQRALVERERSAVARRWSGLVAGRGFGRDLERVLSAGAAATSPARQLTPS